MTKKEKIKQAIRHTAQALQKEYIACVRDYRKTESPDKRRTYQIKAVAYADARDAVKDLYSVIVEILEED